MILGGVLGPQAGPVPPLSSRQQQAAAVSSSCTSPLSCNPAPFCTVATDSTTGGGGCRIGSSGSWSNALPVNSATRSRSRKSSSMARPSFDPTEELQWLKVVLGKVLEQVPEHVRSGASFDDAATFEAKKKKTVALIDDTEQDEPAPLNWGKVGVDLYKRLFADFREFECLGRVDGCIAVADVFDTLLKLRLKRVHSSLLKTYLPGLVDVLACKFPSLKPAVANPFQVAEHSPDLELPGEIRDLVEQLRLLELVVDVLVTPCDDETYAGLLTYVACVKERLAQLVLLDGRIADSAQQLPLTGVSVLAQSASAIRNAENSFQCEAAWKTLLEVVSLVRQHGSELSSTQLARDIKPCRILGLICHALVLKAPNTKASRQTAATVLSELAESPNCMRAVKLAVLQFDDSWAYLLHPLIHGDDPIVSVTVASVLQSILHHRTSLESTAPSENGSSADLRHLLMSAHTERFVEGIELGGEQSGLVMVLSELLHAAPSPLSSASTVRGGASAVATRAVQQQAQCAFHTSIAAAICRRLDPTAAGRQSTTSSQHAIPLIQFLGKCLDTASDSVKRAVAATALAAQGLDILEFWMYSARTDAIAAADLEQVQRRASSAFSSLSSSSSSSSPMSPSSSVLSMASVARGLSSLFGTVGRRQRKDDHAGQQQQSSKTKGLRRPSNVLYGVCYRPFVHLLQFSQEKLATDSFVKKVR